MASSTREILVLFCLVCSACCIDHLGLLKRRTSATFRSVPEIKVVAETSEFSNSFEMDTVEIQQDETDQSVMVLGGRRIPYPLKFWANLVHFNRTLSLKMTMNTLMMRSRPKLIYFGENGTRIEKEDPDSCVYYYGYEASVPDSPSTMSLCDDGLKGVIALGENSLLLEPSAKFSPMKKSGKRFAYGPHVLKQSSLQLNGKYAFDSVPGDFGENVGGRSRRENIEHLTETKYIEMYMVNDKREFQWLGERVENNMKRMKQIANMMDSFYKPHNIRAILIGVEVWNDSDKIVVDKNSKETLKRFLHYRSNNILPRMDNDCSLLATRIDFDGETVGLAPVGTLCSPVNSGSINTDLGRDLSLLAATMTHETGHNLGMKHDTSTCPCAAGLNKCFMTPHSQNPIQTTFSECSIDYLNRYLRQDTVRCLMNVPNLENALHIDGKTCGNNRLDAGEECDCGLPRWCKNTCCNPATCKFTKGSQCDRGSCCKNCKLQLKDTV